MSHGDVHADFARLDRVERVAHRMDRAFRIFGIRVGWDSIIGLIPGVGDTLALAPAGYIVLTARRMGAPIHLLARMVGNIGIDWLLGLVPLLGDIMDVGYKSNSKNAALLRAHIEERHGMTAPPARRTA